MTQDVNIQITRSYPRFIRIIFFTIIIVAAAALLVNPIVKATGRNLILRQLVFAAVHQPAEAFLKPLPCARSPLSSENDRASVSDMLAKLDDSRLRAAGLCLLGDASGASAVYEQAANAGDGWAALEAYYLYTRAGDLPAAQHALDQSNLSAWDLRAFYRAVAPLDLQVDLVALARKAVEADPTNSDGWRNWLYAGDRFTPLKNWQRAEDVYKQALVEQDKLGVGVGRSTFALSAGRLYQSYINPPQLETALSYYNLALTWDDYFLASEKGTTHRYRGEIYHALKPAYSDTQVLSEFEQALQLDPGNYWARLSIASLYLNDINDPARAEIYLRQAITLSPDISDAYLYLGDMYRKLGQLPQAASAYEQALARQPGWQLAVDRLAAVRAKMGNTNP